MKTYPLLVVLLLGSPILSFADASEATGDSAFESRARLLAQTEGWSRLFPERGDDPARDALRARLDQVRQGLERPDAAAADLRRHQADLTQLQDDIMAYLYAAYRRQEDVSYRSFVAGAQSVATEYAQRAYPRAREAAMRLEVLHPRVARGLSTEPSAFFDGTTGRSAGPVTGPARGGAAAAAAAVPAAPNPAPDRYRALRAALLARGVSAQIIDTAIEEGRRANTDPAIVLAVIEQESGFRRTAHNTNSGARGLMQLVPATAGDMGVRDAGALFDVRTNIRAGVRYLNWIANSFFRLNLDMSDVTRVPAVRLQQVLAAYNWGIGNVQRVVRRSGAAALERVAPAETRNYISEIPGRISSWVASFF